MNYLFNCSKLEVTINQNLHIERCDQKFNERYNETIMRTGTWV